MNTETRKHSAKRLATGHYVYRGYEIEDVSFDAGYTMWAISVQNTRAPFEAANTLRDAKEMIDHWELAGASAKDMTDHWKSA